MHAPTVCMQPCREFHAQALSAGLTWVVFTEYLISDKTGQLQV